MKILMGEGSDHLNSFLPLGRKKLTDARTREIDLGAGGLGRNGIPLREEEN